MAPRLVAQITQVVGGLSGLTMLYSFPLPFIVSYSLSSLSQHLILFSTLIQFPTRTKSTADMDSDLESHPMFAGIEEEAPPPSYHSAIRDVKTTLALQNNTRHQPPSTHYFVSSYSEPSALQLLVSGPLMSNVTASENTAPSHKRRYRILYPPSKYEDVYLHKPRWTAQTSAFPLYFSEVYSGRDRYNAEPIIVLGPPEESSPYTAEAKVQASRHTKRVISAVDKQVGDMTCQATTAEMEFLSCDWSCKTSAAYHDMRTMLLKAKEELEKSVGLVGGLEDFLAYIGISQDDILAELKRSCEGVGFKVGWMLQMMRP